MAGVGGAGRSSIAKQCTIGVIIVIDDVGSANCIHFNPCRMGSLVTNTILAPIAMLSLFFLFVLGCILSKMLQRTLHLGFSSRFNMDGENTVVRSRAYAKVG